MQLLTYRTTIDVDSKTKAKNVSDTIRRPHLTLFSDTNSVPTRLENLDGQARVAMSHEQKVWHLTQFLFEHYQGTLPSMLISVANGTNQLTLDAAARLEGQSIALLSEKDKSNPNKLTFNDVTYQVLDGLSLRHIVVVEDVVQTGGKALQVVENVRDLVRDCDELEVVTLWRDPRHEDNLLTDAGVHIQPVFENEYLNAL